MGKSFFEKRPVFSIRKLSVGACSVVIGISALGLSRVHAEEKPALESEPTSMETPSVVTENSEAEVPEAGARVSEAQERKKQLLQIKIVQRRILCKIENVILIKIGILN